MLGTLELPLLVRSILFPFYLSQCRAERQTFRRVSPPQSKGGNSRRLIVRPNYSSSYGTCNTLPNPASPLSPGSLLELIRHLSTPIIMTCATSGQRSKERHPTTFYPWPDRTSRLSLMGKGLSSSALALFLSSLGIRPSYLIKDFPTPDLYGRINLRCRTNFPHCPRMITASNFLGL